MEFGTLQLEKQLVMVNGFESHPLRHLPCIHAGLLVIDESTHKYTIKRASLNRIPYITTQPPSLYASLAFSGYPWV